MPFARSSPLSGMRRSLKAGSAKLNRLALLLLQERNMDRRMPQFASSCMRFSLDAFLHLLFLFLVICNQRDFLVFFHDVSPQLPNAAIFWSFLALLEVVLQVFRRSVELLGM